MKSKMLLSGAILIFSILLWTGAAMYGTSGQAAASPNDTADSYYAFLDNPIDPLFARALSGSSSMAEYRQIQELYYQTWKTQYDRIMKEIRKKCKYEEDIANYDLFVKEMDKGFGHLQPLILNEMLDQYDMPESPEKHSWGNGTHHALQMYQGAWYRNACMFFISAYTKSEYQFPMDTIKNTLSAIKEY